MASVSVLAVDSNRSVLVNDINSKRKVTVNNILPFRIRVTNIQVPGYSPTLAPPIGIAIIGFNNYIL